MYKDWPAYTKTLSGAMQGAREGIPDTWAAFSKLAAESTKTGALDPKTKELTAIGIAIAVRCDGCIAFHVRAAVRHGATRDEMLETIGMAIYMGGGPASIYGSLALEAYDQFVAAKKG
ncbi:carboxymuconolactone decarboxylase family protein [Roseospira visakhapatnamensis]|uniref:AhpD family alkylhydroperoxidase n=1 Tax=Roseospira visakhapatnamensis TaxID=390880 RepID=A0A7W6REE7_9PROT|nr:carboxymuconolactone decarboxylase family protein [Roseospira visakhapatnamensis]MBB4266902.1 AhpD family alkylhydroperoxidase [Roseospira visakhapatnamensis]